MKHTRYLFVLFFSLLVVSGALHAQSIGFSNDEGIKTSSGELQSSNSKLLKELKRLHKKGKRELGKQYPNASEKELDSLIAHKKAEIQNNLKDSAESGLSEIRKQMVEDLAETPEKLPVSDEVKESIEGLKELEAMELLKKDTIKAKDIFSAQNLRKVDKRAGEVLDDLGKYKSQFKDWDKTLLSQVESIPEAQLLKEQMEKVKAYKPLPEGYRQNMQQFQTNDFVKEQLETKAEELEKIGESLQDRFDDAMLKMQEAKEEFPSLESLEDAPKRYNPYSDQPLLKRLKFGGNLNFNPQKPASIDVVGNIIYPINKRLSTGLETGGRIRLQKADVSNTTQEINKDLWNLRLVGRYALSSSFYLQSNYEVSQFRVGDIQGDSSALLWYRTALIGLGRQFTVKEKIKMNITTFYDLFYNPQTSPNSKAWIVRLGFEIN